MINFFQKSMIIFAFLFFSFRIFSEEIQYPVKTTNLPMKISSTFGESRRDHFHNGLDIVSVNEPVVPIANATLVYYRYSQDNPFEEQLGPGNVVWLEHSGGVLSGYYHLKDGKRKILSKTLKIPKNKVFGVTGNTGHSTGAHLHFVLSDHFGKKIINPQIYLPPIPDTKQPTIGNLYITTDKGFSTVKDGDSIRLSKNFPVSIDVQDAGENPYGRRGIYKIKCILNNQTILQASFDSISLKDGKWVNDEGYSFQSLYFEDKYYLENLEFASGENSLVVITSDFNKNQSVKNINIIVNRFVNKAE
jgi:hypothetical protein